MAPRTVTFISRIVLLVLSALLPPIRSVAQSQTPLLTELHTIATPDVPVPVEHSFTIANAGTYNVTLTDLGAQLTPAAPLATVTLAVTQGNTVLAALTTGLSHGTGAISFAATANTAYTLHIVGSPAAGIGSGTVGEDITAADGSSIESYVDALAPPTPSVANNESILNDTFSVASDGDYTVTLSDLQFPVALNPLVLAVVPTGGAAPVVTLGPAPPWQKTAHLGAGTYQIVAIGKTDSSNPAAIGGLFTASVSGSGGTPYPAKITTVGSVALVGSAALGAGNYTLGLNDLAFPAGLAQVGAVLVRDDGTPMATLGTSGSQPFTVATSGNNYLAFALATAAAAPGAGSYSVSVQQQPASGPPPLSTARAVIAPGGALAAYAFDATMPTAGTYVVTLTDFQFPAPLIAASLAASQGGVLLGAPLTIPGSFTVTAAQGPITLLALGQATANGALLGVDVSPSGGGAAALDVTQGVGAAFHATRLSIGTAQSLTVTATDLLFPAALGSFNITVTQGTQRLGSIVSAGSSGSFKFQATPGSYFVNVVAQPTGTSKAGTYYLSVAPTPPAPVVTLTADAMTIDSGGTVHLTWSAQNATSCTASGGSGWTGSKDPAGGTTQTSALMATTTFTLSCTGPGGTTPQTLTVTVVTPAAPASHSGGGDIDLCVLLMLLAVVLSRKARWRAVPAA